MVGEEISQPLQHEAVLNKRQPGDSPKKQSKKNRQTGFKVKAASHTEIHTEYISCATLVFLLLKCYTIIEETCIIVS